MEIVTERVPADWRGSDLRSRREVVQYLADRGGVLEDKTGLVVGKMREELKRGRSLAQLLADMEQDGMIAREVRGRRTFRVELLDDWGLTEEAPVISLVSAEPEVYDQPAGSPPDLDLGGVDLQQLAEVLLGVVVKRMTEPAEERPTGGPTNRELSERLRRADREVAGLQTDLREAKEALTTAKDQLAEERRLRLAAEHNIDVLRGELAKVTSRKKVAGAPIGEMIGEEGRKALERLMQALPESPASKTRRAAK